MIPEGIELFSNCDSDAQYLGWLARHPNGYVVACTKYPRPGSQMKLHRAACIWISDPAKGPFTTRDYGKACAVSRLLLSDWGQNKVQSQWSTCAVCKP